jgi:hypothetical protein
MNQNGLSKEAFSMTFCNKNLTIDISDRVAFFRHIETNQGIGKLLIKTHTVTNLWNKSELYK